MQVRTQKILCFSALFLSACASASVSELPTTAATGIDGQSCVGAAPAAIDGLSPASNAALQAKAQFASGKGGVCSEWNKLDRLMICQLKVGAQVVLGTTQSVTCADGTVYPKTAAVQVYMPNDSKNGVLYIENCRAEGRWP